MSKTTENYKLTKPELTDSANITAMDENWDTIDEALKKLSDAIENLTPDEIGAANSKHSHTPEEIGALALSGGVMTGNGFYINNKTVRIVGNENGIWLRTASSDVDNNPDSRHLKLWNATYVEELVRSLCMFDTTTGKDYIIYGQHNLTAGTSDLTAGSSSLASGAIYLVYE